MAHTRELLTKHGHYFTCLINIFKNATEKVNWKLMGQLSSEASSFQMKMKN